MDRTDPEACRQLVETYIDKVVVYREKVEVVLKISGPSDNGGGGGPCLILSEIACRVQLYHAY